MTEATPTSAHEALAQVRTHFTHWRQQRPTPRGTPIPQPLWAEAVRLTQLLPLTQVAKHLALKPAALRRHAGLASVPPAPPSRLAPTFVEVTRAPTVPTTEVEL